MGKIAVEYNKKTAEYNLRFNTSDAGYAVEESSWFGSFAGAAGFILREFEERITEGRSLDKYSITIPEEAPQEERRVLEGIVREHNRTPEILFRIMSRDRNPPLEAHQVHWPNR